MFLQMKLEALSALWLRGPLKTGEQGLSWSWGTGDSETMQGMLRPHTGMLGSQEVSAGAQETGQPHGG